MEIKHNQGKTNGVFYMEDNGKQISTMTYVFRNENTFIIEHTVVDPVYGGKGLGKQLVKAAVNFARENNYKIIPLCPFAKGIFDRMPEFSDVLA
jgi:predicted GNAT family acetyltransferase